ncbi:MAG: hypothetical protein HFI31_06130 [Lachnospiraceae bacterium]|nr:hypothetical protein [Lachnospiraceae bacterium]
MYKGIYTSEERATALMDLETYIKDHTTDDDKLLFMEVVSMAYLMSNGEFCTPSPWDITLYSYGFNDDRIMRTYLGIVEDYPTKIIYIDTGRDEILSIDCPGYQFNEFVEKDYESTNIRKIGDMFEIKIYERQQRNRRPCQE